MRLVNRVAKYVTSQISQVNKRLGFSDYYYMVRTQKSLKIGRWSYLGFYVFPSLSL